MMGETVLVAGRQVGNVLVEPGLSRDAEDVKRPVGTVVDYTLRFPSSFEGPLAGEKVVVRGVELDMLARADHWNPRAVFGSWTNPWDMTVLVGRALGDFTAAVRVVAVAAALDALGDPVRAESTVYEGAAQARMTEGYESDGDFSMTDAREHWRFVVPWRDAFAALRPQSTRIDWDGARYDVQSISNIDMQSQHASFEAVRNG